MLILRSIIKFITIIFIISTIFLLLAYKHQEENIISYQIFLYN